MNITESELLAAVRDAGIVGDAPPDAMTVAEMAIALGLSVRAVQRRIENLRRDDRLCVHRKVAYDAAGRAQRVPAYTIKPAAKRTR